MGRNSSITSNVYNIKEARVVSGTLTNVKQESIKIPDLANLRNGKSIAITHVKYYYFQSAGAVQNIVQTGLVYGIPRSLAQVDAQGNNAFLDRDDLFAYHKRDVVITVNSGRIVDEHPIVIDYSQHPKLICIPLTWSINVLNLASNFFMELVIEYFDVDVTPAQFQRFMSLYGKIPTSD